MKRVAGTTRSEPIVPIPPIVKPVAVELTLRAIRVEHEDVPVVVRVEPLVLTASCATTRRILFGLNLIRHRNAIAVSTKYLQILNIR